jgi:hypothetical protein
MGFDYADFFFFLLRVFEFFLFIILPCIILLMAFVKLVLFIAEKLHIL